MPKTSLLTQFEATNSQMGGTVCSAQFLLDLGALSYTSMYVDGNIYSYTRKLFTIGLGIHKVICEEIFPHIL